MANINWQTARMCADVSDGVYYTGDRMFGYFSKYLNQNVQTIIPLEHPNAQGLMFLDKQDRLVIVFRGTESDQTDDIVADAKIWSTQSDTCGMVHTGFKQELDKLWTQVTDALIAEPDRHLIITGHSLGAAMATLCASRLTQAGHSVELYTFGSPKVGDPDWAKQFNAINAYRFVNNNDLVTQVPLFQGYEHVGTLYYMDYDGNIISECTPEQRDQDRRKSWLRALAKGQLFDELYDHSMEKYIERIEKHISSCG